MLVRALRCREHFSTARFQALVYVYTFEHPASTSVEMAPWIYVLPGQRRSQFCEWWMFTLKASAAGAVSTVPRPIFPELGRIAAAGGIRAQVS